MGVPCSLASLWLGTGLLLLSGLPISTNLSKKQILYSLLCFSGYVIVSVHFVYSFSSEEFASRALVEKYSVLSGYNYSFGSFLTFSVLFLQRTHLRENIATYRSVVDQIKCHQRHERNTLVFLLRILVVALTISSIVMDTIASLLDHDKDIPRDYEMYLVSLLSLTTSVVVYAMVYNMTIGFILVIEIHFWLAQRMLGQRDVRTLDTVLPVVEVDHSFCVSMAHLTHGRTASSYRCSPWYFNIQRYRKYKRTFSQVQDFRLRLNQLYYTPLAFMSFVYACFFPIMFTIPYFGQETSNSSTPVTSTTIVVGIVYGATILIPYCSKQLLKYRNSCLSVQINKEAYIISGPHTKNIMLNMSSCVKNRYVESPCYFFEIDSEVLSLVLETSILMATTFLVQTNS